MGTSLTEQLQEKLTDGLESAFDVVRESRREQYEKNPAQRPVRADIDKLIRDSVATNATITGGASLIPGPWGMLAVVPELILVIKNQIGLIYDIGTAYGKEKQLTRELLLGVFISAAGASAGSLLSVHGGKVLVRRASLQTMQKMIAVLGGRVTQQALKSAVSKWLPIVGAAAMAAWTGYLTNQIGKRAKEIFELDIADDPSTLDIELATPAPEAVAAVAAPGTEPAVESLLEFCKLQVLIDLAKIDGRLAEAEMATIEEALASPDLSDEQRTQLRAALAGKSEALQGMDLLAARPDSAIALLATMVALARKDEEFHVAEKMYIRRVGGMLGFPAADVDEMIATA